MILAAHRGGSEPGNLLRSRKEDAMPAVIADRPLRALERTARTVVYTTLYDLIAAVNDAVEPGDEAYVALMVADLLHAGHARWLRDIDVGMLEIEPTQCVSP
jgi:hypothetical protein